MCVYLVCNDLLLASFGSRITMETTFFREPRPFGSSVTTTVGILPLLCSSTSSKYTWHMLYMMRCVGMRDERKETHSILKQHKKMRAGVWIPVMWCDGMCTVNPKFSLKRTHFLSLLATSTSDFFKTNTLLESINPVLNQKWQRFFYKKKNNEVNEGELTQLKQTIS
jgi:hypothetical protein